MTALASTPALAGRNMDARQLRDAQATSLMDRFRRERCPQVFEALVRLTKEQLAARVEAKVRFLHLQVDPQEVLQDAYINIFNYPDRFEPRRPGAFRAWAGTIVDNAVRRSMRQFGRGSHVTYCSSELLSRQADLESRRPDMLVARSEELRRDQSTFGLFLQLYLQAYAGLSSKERFVLQMVEVAGMRYAELAPKLQIRPEALKMVVFRARKRIYQSIRRRIGQAL